MLQIVYKHEKELPHRTCVISGEQELNGVVSLLTKRSLALHLDCVGFALKTELYEMSCAGSLKVNMLTVSQPID
jgi:hypothetical protein